MTRCRAKVAFNKNKGTRMEGREYGYNMNIVW